MAAEGQLPAVGNAGTTCTQTEGSFDALPLRVSQQRQQQCAGRGTVVGPVPNLQNQFRHSDNAFVQ